MRQMLGDWIALVAAAAQHHRRPEVADSRDVLFPIVHGGIEDRPYQVILTHPAIEGTEQLRERGFESEISHFMYVIAFRQAANRNCVRPLLPGGMNQPQRWTQNDITLLRDRVRAGEQPDDIARQLGREPEAIRTMMGRLRLSSTAVS